MKLLLDTHTFLWLMGDPEKLSDTARRVCRDPENVLWLSLVSVWEIQIKLQLGRIDLEVPLATMVESHPEESLRPSQGRGHHEATMALGRFLRIEPSSIALGAPASSRLVAEALSVGASSIALGAPASSRLVGESPRMTL